MSAHEHTPGPWVVADAHGPIDGATCVQSIHDSNLVASCTHYYPRGMVQANARVIAAAPELLEIVETFDAYMGHAGEEAEQDSLNPIRALRWKAQQVIAKATGSQT